MLKHLQPLQISEEMLGAYLEGHLSLDEASYVEALLQTDESLKELISEVALSGDFLNEKLHSYQVDCDLDSLSDFQLPELQMPDSFDEGTIMDAPMLSGLCEDTVSFDISDGMIDSTSDTGDMFSQEIENIDSFVSGGDEPSFGEIDLDI